MLANGKSSQRSRKLLTYWAPHWATWACIILGLLLLGLGSGKLWARWHTTHAGGDTIPLVVTKSTNHPSEAPISPSTSYKVAPDLPRQITLPTINTQGFIQQVTTNKDNTIVVPSNINLAGWYTASVKPGDPGVSIIDGHIGGYYKLGIFKDLSRLAAGDVFSVTFGNGKSKSFQVISVHNYSVSAATAHLFDRASSVTNQLTLITCGGKYNAPTQSYDQRTLVVSTLITHT